MASMLMAESAAARYVSKRGLQHGLKPFLRYVPALFKAMADLYHPTDNPNGYVVTTLSENTQMAEEMMLKLQQRPPTPYSRLQLGDYNGSPDLRNGIRELVQRELSCNIDLRDDHIMCLSGAVGVMTASACALFNPGEALLILTPCYPGFFNDFSVPGDVHTVKVPLKHPKYEIDLNQLEEAFQQSVDSGHQPRAVLITNPSNPTGLCYSKEELRSLLRWVREKKLFYISSEVYGSTCYGQESSETGKRQKLDRSSKFVSIIDVAYDEAQSSSDSSAAVDLSRVLGNDIQIIWSASKDLGLSGLRVGASICQNPLVHAAMCPYGIPAQISRESQYTISLLLNDKEWIQNFYPIMRSKLRQGCTIVEETLKRLNIPFVQPYAGLFIWLDLSEFLPYYYKQNLKASSNLQSIETPSNNDTPTTATSTSPDCSTENSDKVQQQPSDAQLNEAEWAMFEDIFFCYKLGLAPGLDFAPPRRSIHVPKPFLCPKSQSSAGLAAAVQSATWTTSAGFMRMCFGAVPLPLIPVALNRLETFVMDKRREMQNLIDAADKEV